MHDEYGMTTVREYRKAVRIASRVVASVRFGTVIDPVIRISKKDALAFVDDASPSESCGMYGLSHFAVWENGEVGNTLRIG